MTLKADKRRKVAAAIKASKLRFMPWDELRKITREPGVPTNFVIGAFSKALQITNGR